MSRFLHHPAWRHLAIAVLAAGCASPFPWAMTRKAFDREAPVVWCELHDSCGLLEDLEMSWEECEAAFVAGISCVEGFAHIAAEQCMDELVLMTCDSAMLPFDEVAPTCLEVCGVEGSGLQP